MNATQEKHARLGATLVETIGFLHPESKAHTDVDKALNAFEVLAAADVLGYFVENVISSLDREIQALEGFRTRIQAEYKDWDQSA